MVDRAIEVDDQSRSHNWKASSKGIGLLFLGITLPLALILNFFASNLSDKILKEYLGKDGADTLNLYLVRKINPSLLLNEV